MKKNIFIFLLFFNYCNQYGQSYAFDSVLIGKYYGISYRHDSSDTTLFTKCSIDTMTVDESIYPQTASYLHCQTYCWGIAQGHDFLQYYSDTSFIRLPASCQCFNGKYYGFNDSITLKFYSPPNWNVFYRFYGRKYWSPVSGWVGIRDQEKKERVFELYPNPAAAKVSIVFGDGYLPYNRRGEVLDLNGRLVMEFEFPANGNSAVVNVAELSEDVYTIKVNDYDRVITKRLVVIR